MNANRTRVADHLTAWAEIADDLFNCTLIAPDGEVITVPMVIKAAVEIEENWAGWSIEAR